MTDQQPALNVLTRIDEAYDLEVESKSRKYIGASGVGNPCDANLAFCLRGFPNTEPPAFLKRIFAMGHLIEEVVVADLKKVKGAVVIEIDPETGKQWSYQELGGHISSHTDGVIELDGKSYILEIKSMNNTSFQKFLNKGVKISHHSYYCQLMMYMALADRTEAFFIAYNKDKSRYHAEIVEFDQIEWSYLKQRIVTVLNGDAAKISTDATDWRCRGCFKLEVCWGEKAVPVEASSCQFGVPQKDGTWLCTGCKGTKGCDDPSKYMRYHPQPRE
jgi:CRISPR/Cas system-associated exonuclease Cas4 (RecB family)